MSDEQRFCGGCFEGDSALCADDRVPEVDRAADSEGGGECLEGFNESDRIQALTIECARPTALTPRAPRVSPAPRSD